MRDWKKQWQSDGSGGWLSNEAVGEFIEWAIRDEAGKVRRALFEKPGLARARDQDGVTALARCSFYGSLGAMRELLRLSDPKARSLSGDTALMRAASEGQAEAVRLLLPVSDARVQDQHGNTALLMAAGWGNVECVELLLPVSDAEAVGLWNGQRLTAEGVARARNANEIASRIAARQEAAREREELDRALPPLEQRPARRV